MRLPDWKTRLIAYVSDAARTPFQMGVHDCALFSAGAVLAMTGVDYAANWRGRYTTLTGGLRVLRKEGFADHIDLAARTFDEVHPAFADLGDLAVIPTPEGDVLGVVQGEMIYGLNKAGIAYTPRERAMRAFRVA